MKVYAKCNLSLNVLGRRPDGYHDLDMAVCSVSLFDEVEVLSCAGGAVTCVMDGVVQTANTAIDAAELFQKETGCGGLEIKIKKGIPERAGLGGSSADAAAVFCLLGELFPGRTALFDLASRVGSDTVYMLGGGFARMRGRGERVERFDCPQKLWFVFLQGSTGVSTAEAFRLADEQGGGRIGEKLPISEGDLRIIRPQSDNSKLIRALNRGTCSEAAREFGNGLFPAAAKLDPEMFEIAVRLSKIGGLAVNMTGSGSGLYACFDSKARAERGLELLNDPRALLFESV